MLVLGLWKLATLAFSGLRHTEDTAGPPDDVRAAPPHVVGAQRQMKKPRPRADLGGLPSAPLPLRRMRRRHRIAVLVAAAAATGGGGLVVLAWPSSEPDPVPLRGRCGGVVKEKLDSRSLQHVLPGTPPPTFATEQPTSGPHSPVERAGVLVETLSPVLQVGLLEEGSILLQHQGLDDEARRRLEALAGPKVIVAPGRNLPSAVLATAWTFKLRCDGVEDTALRSFIARHQGGGLG